MAETRVIASGTTSRARVLMHQRHLRGVRPGRCHLRRPAAEQGLYHRGTRYVSRLDLRSTGSGR